MSTCFSSTTRPSHHVSIPLEAVPAVAPWGKNEAVLLSPCCFTVAVLGWRRLSQPAIASPNSFLMPREPGRVD